MGKIIDKVNLERHRVRLQRPGFSGMKRKLRLQLLALALFTLIVLVIGYPREGDILRIIGIDTDLHIRRGLDLQGGVYLVYEAAVPEDEDAGEALEQAAAVIQRRVNPGGASETIVQTADNNRIVVQLPDVDDPQAAIDLIGQTAQLEFYEVDFEAEDPEQPFAPTGLSGEDVARADPGYDQVNRPIVNLRLRSGESTRKFGELTSRVHASGTQLLILLDDEPVFGPGSVQQPILTGEAMLTGSETIQEAQDMSTLLNAGALPVPIELVAQQTIGPTLGAEAVSASVVAGAIGLVSLVLFLLAVYRMSGLVAVSAMTIYTAAMLTVFKLSALPIFGGYTIVLTLAGIAGFIMSIAVAADANILILERLKEERAAGTARPKAVETGFNHAWSSIRDASVATLIICIVLYYLANRFGEASIQGFALVLAIGVTMNITSVLLVTRTLLRGVVRTRLGDKL